MTFEEFVFIFAIYVCRERVNILLMRPLFFSMLSDAYSLNANMSSKLPPVATTERNAGVEAYESRLKELEVEKLELSRKCQGIV